MKYPFEFHKDIMVRVPRLPIINDYNIEDVLAFYKVQHAREALYVASPSLYNKLLAYEEGNVTEKKDLERFYASITRYYIRMHTRTTPFGLFAGVSTFEWDQDSDKSEIILGDSLKRKTKFDMDFLCDLGDYIASLPSIKKHLKLHANSSLSTNKDEFRFVDYKREIGKRTHQVSSLKYSDYIQYVVERANFQFTAHDIAHGLTQIDDEISLEEGLQFVDALIDMQLICTELEYSLTGDDYFDKICRLVESIQGEEEELIQAKKFLSVLSNALEVLDNPEKNSIDDYKIIHEAIKEAGVIFKEHTLFQIDMGLDLKSAQLKHSIQNDILKAVDCLNRLTPETPNKNLTAFRDKFIDRFENNEIPLLYLLDVDYGIGYGQGNQKDHNSLTNDLHFYHDNDVAPKVEWSESLNWKITALFDALKNGEFEIDLLKKNVPKSSVNWNNLSTSISVMFRAVNEDDIFLDTIGNSSAVNLLARFANDSNDIENTLREISQKEQELNPDVILAEVVHLSDDRLGNILRRPSFRDYEIPYLGKSDKRDEQRIELKDIVVAVLGGRIVLKSKKLNKEIVPKLGTAHNFSMSTQPIYKFLCDLQFQSLRNSLYFTWGMCSSLSKFLPRVRVGKVIVSAASWTLLKEDFGPLLKANKDSLTEALTKFKKKFNLPEEFIFLEFDNELLVNTNNPLSVQAWLAVIKNKQTITLKELFASQKIVQNSNGEIHNNQFVTSLIKTRPTYEDMPTFGNTPLADKLQTYSIGSEWLYYKIYTGQKCMEDILLNKIYPCCKLLHDKGLIDKWFFIRYYDGDHHIRIRMHHPERINLSEINSIFRSFLLDYLETGKIWKIQVDTYQRETERYGKNTMHLAESLFFFETLQVLTFLRSISSSEAQNDRWFWFIKATDMLLNHLEFSLEERVDLFDRAKKMFLSEFNAKRDHRNKISLKYRTLKPEIEKVIEQDSYTDYIGLNDFNHHIERICKEVLEFHKADKLGLSKIDLTHSYIHMLANRLFTDFHRKKELVLNDFLFRYYKSAHVRSQKMKESTLVNS